MLFTTTTLCNPFFAVYSWAWFHMLSDYSVRFSKHSLSACCVPGTVTSTEGRCKHGKICSSSSQSTGETKAKGKWRMAIQGETCNCFPNTKLRQDFEGVMLSKISQINTVWAHLYVELKKKKNLIKWEIRFVVARDSKWEAGELEEDG